MERGAGRTLTLRLNSRRAASITASISRVAIRLRLPTSVLGGIGRRADGVQRVQHLVARRLA